MSQITTHILDTSVGKPAAGVMITLHTKTTSGWQLIASGITNRDGRVSDLLQEDRVLESGIYKLEFETKPYFLQQEIKTFYPSVAVEFEVSDSSHYHVPLLLNPYGYSTYRGS